MAERYPLRAGELPHEIFAARRRSDPLGQVEVPSGDLVRLAVRFDDVKAVLTDPRFSTDPRLPGAPRFRRSSSDTPDAIFHKDPPDLNRLRRLVAGALGPRRLGQWRPRIHEIADRLLADMLSGHQPADLSEAYAFPLPLYVICELLGVPAEDVGRFRKWSDAFLSTTSLTPEERDALVVEFRDFLAGLIAARRRSPGGEGLLDALIEAGDVHGRLTDSELVTLVQTLIAAGHESVATTIGRGGLVLLSHPERYAALCREPELLEQTVEEILRYEFVGSNSLIRTATEDVELPSGTIPKGTGVITALASANRDGGRFARPDVFDVRRAPNPHLAFGAGPHYCLGAGLARLELSAAFSALTRAVPGLRLAVPPQDIRFTVGLQMRRVERLPVAWPRGEGAAS